MRFAPWSVATIAFMLFAVFAGASLALLMQTSQAPVPVDHAVDIRLAGVWNDTASVYVQSAPVIHVIPFNETQPIMDMEPYGYWASIGDKNLTAGDWFFFPLPDCNPHTIQVMVGHLSAFSAVVQRDCAATCLAVLPILGCLERPEGKAFNTIATPEVRS